MAMGRYPQIGASVGLILRPFRDAMVVCGRSSRTEMLLFCISGPLLAETLALLLAQSGFDAFAATARALFFIPLFGLVPRRLHDIGVSGWPGPLIVGLAAMMTVANGQLLGAYPEMLVRDAALLALLAILVWRPMAGANRFGSDPRLRTIANAFGSIS